MANGSGLKASWGVEEPSPAGSDHQAKVFKKGFCTIVEPMADRIGYMSVHAPQGVHAGMTAKSEKLYQAYQKVANSIDPTDPKKAQGPIKKVLQAAKDTDKKYKSEVEKTKAAHQASAQIAVVPQNRPQRDLILSNKRSGLIVAVPVGAKLVDLFEAYEKKARFCVIMRIVISMSSSYRLNAKSSSGRTRIFSALAHPISDTDPCTRIKTHPLRVFTLSSNQFSSPAQGNRCLVGAADTHQQSCHVCLGGRCRAHGNGLRF